MNFGGAIIPGMRDLISLFASHCTDRATLDELAGCVSDRQQWKKAHALFQRIREKNLAARGDMKHEAQYRFEEACAKTLYNLSGSSAPFDADSPFWVIPTAIKLAQQLGIDESLALCLVTLSLPRAEATTPSFEKFPLKEAINTALNFAFGGHSEGCALKELHRNRSKKFVKALAGQFKNHYEKSSSVLVFSSAYPDNRKEFGLNELLFDILVCNSGTVRSAKNKADLTFVSKGIWAVESEFAKDSRQAIRDFSKLVLAAACYKLFIGAMVKTEKQYCDALLEPAKRCTGRVFLAMVTHPSKWGAGEIQVKLFELSNGEWKCI